MFGCRSHSKALGLFFLLAWLATSNGAVSQTKSGALEALLREARAAAAREQWNQAESVYRQAIRLSPHEAGLRVELGAVLRGAGRLPDTIAEYQQALEIDRRNEPAELGLGEAYRLAFNYEEARRWFERARQEHPASAAAVLALGTLDIQLQHYDDAIRHLRRALELAPDNRAARDDLAAAYRGKGEPVNALKVLDASLAGDPQDALAHYLRAQIYTDRNDNARALPDAEKVVELQPGNAPGRQLLGKLLLRVKQCSRSAEVLRPLAASPPVEPETLYLLAHSYECAGEADLAKKTLDEFAAAFQQDHLSTQAKIQADHLVREAGDHARNNELQPALELLQQALQKDPQNASAYSQLAKIYFSQHEIEKAHDAVNHALKIQPYHPDYLYVLGRILEAEGDWDGALRAFQQTVLVNPRESDAYYEMGRIYQQRTDIPHAREALKKAVELSPDDPDYRRALAELSPGGKSP